jgi:hypothetical protein
MRKAKGKGGSSWTGRADDKTPAPAPQVDDDIEDNHGGW